MEATERLELARERQARLALAAASRLALAELDRITGDTGFEPSRFRERLRAFWALSDALAVNERLVSADA